MDDIIQELLKELEDPKIEISRSELQKYLYREMVRLTLLIDDSLSEPQVLGLMSALVKKARYQVNATSDAERIQQLLDLVYQEWKFNCDYEGYFHTDNLLLNRVIRRHQGMPVSVGAIVLYLAAALDLPLYPVNFPTQLILRAEMKDEKGKTTVRFINPWDGSFLPMELLIKWLEGEVGYGVELSPDLLRKAQPNELLERVETVFKMALTREKKYEETLRVIEYRLAFSPEDPYEIRDRGMVLASMDCYQAAYEDLSYFIDQCPEDPSAVMLKLEMKGLEQKSKESRLH
ncbi:tetratricopeptide repeat protein [Actinobacillus equuli subsp. haemolyticus]|uniref:SirB1 family protein n=1 Tax=Actinobacillus TaxID=713 RepID=UPI00036AD8B7|nr:MULTISPECIES: tetratricopeptide repeat protein [Actinobacillus]MDG4953601.1 tetratricopeptide repeat protein [Actinobacillus equuli subsp. equuli]WGE46623.1 tetratricopeptide repeat protein [Actinobacillus equuli subsp. haemolyticus]WGE50810.1 tetratricopeptide repeat protein [Actinobacillus equuli subsp. haemolyticus]WGE63245.1 tetratricopeptide repeat protein [Actinobacillus equuli subsp. haemolyticus]